MSHALQILTSKPVKILAVIFILLAVGLRISAHVMGGEKYRQFVIDEITAITNKKVTIDGTLSINTIPILNIAKLIIPKISIHDPSSLEKDPFLKAEKVVINLSLLDFFLGKMHFKSIELIEANIYLKDNQSQHTKNWSFITNLDSTKNEFTKIKNISLNNTTLVLSNSNGIHSLKQMNLEVDLSNKNKIHTNGNLTFNDKKMNIISLLNYNDKTLSLQLNSDGSNTSINGKLSNIDDQLQINGDTKIHLTKPGFITQALVETIPSISSSALVDLKEALDITANLSLSTDFLEMKNIKIASPHTNGNGDIKFFFTDRQDMVLNLNFDTLDLTNFISFDGNNVIQAFSDKILDTGSSSTPTTAVSDSNSYLNFKLLDSKNLSIKLDIAKLSMKNVDLQNMSMNLDTKIGTVTKVNLAFTIIKGDYSTDIKLKNLNITEIEGTHVLVGEFINEGKDINKTFHMLDLQEILDINGTQLDYSINSKIVLSPKEISLFEVVGKIGALGSFSGSVASTRDDMSHYNFDLKFSDLKLNNISMPLLQERLSTLITKSDEDNYLSYFRWFRTLSSSYRFKLDFKNIEIHNEKIANLTTTCKMVPGNMSFKLDVQSDFADGVYQIDLSATQLKPSLDLKVNAINLNFDRLKPLLLALSNTSSDDFAVTAPASQIWSDNKLNIFKINKYTTTLDLSVQKLTSFSKHIDNFRFIAHATDDILYIDNWYFKIYGGEVQSKGNISFFDILLFQFSFTTSGVETKDLLAGIFPTITGIEGPMAATGSMITQGITPKSLIANLSLSTNFAAPTLTLKGMDADAIVDVALRRKNVDKDHVINSLDNLMKTGTSNLTNIGGIFKGIKGIITTDNTNFRTNFSNAVFVMSMDLNNLTFSSDTKFIFTPYAYKTSMDYDIILSGDLRYPLNRNVDTKKLLKYVKWLYGIITDEDIAAAKKIATDRAKALAEDPDNKDYLYYKLQQQNNGDLKKDESTNKLNQANPPTIPTTKDTIAK